MKKDNAFEKSVFDVEGLKRKMKSHWYLFMLAAILFIGLAYVYTSVATKEYRITSKILVSDEPDLTDNSNSDFTSKISAKLNTKNNTQNELQMLKSRSLFADVVNDLRLNTRIMRRDGLGMVEIYDEAPFDVIVIERADSITKREFDIEILDRETIRVENDEEALEQEVAYGKRIRLSKFDLIINKKAAINIAQGDYFVEVVSKDAAVKQLMGAFEAGFSAKGATTVDIDFSYSHPKRGEIILNRLMNLYLLKNKRYKLNDADSAIQLIDRRLALVSSQLENVEKDLESYRSSNSIANIDEQSRVLVNSANDYTKKLNDQQVQLTVIEDLEDYLLQPGNEAVVPSSLSIQNASFASVLERYNDLLLEREGQKLSNTASNPVLRNLESQIESLRSSLLENIRSYKKEIRLTINDISSQKNAYNAQIQSVPNQERMFLDLSRQQNLKQELYLYLLQKREEAAISQATSPSNAKVVDFAKSEAIPYKPNKQLVYMLAALMSFLFPASYVVLKGEPNPTIDDTEEISSYIDVQVIGEISHNYLGRQLVVDNSSRSLIAENFRNLRTNLLYALDSGKSNAILITSSMRGEGKSFVCLNLGSSLALINKKVVFIELDLRMPMLSDYMGVDNHHAGFSDYANSSGRDISSIIKPSKHHPNCYIVSSGHIPENPSELLHGSKLPELICSLKEQFDYVIIDSPPLGLVSDSLLISPYVDATIYVTRQKYTFRSQIPFINSLSSSNKIKDMYLVVNDIKIKKGEYLNYGYGYELPKEKPSLLALPLANANS